MRKQNPNDVVDDFLGLLNASLGIWSKTCTQVVGTTLRKNASADAFLNAAIGWESFLTDWHIAAINPDSTAFVQEWTTNIEKGLDDKWPGLKGHITLSLPKHPSLALIREILDHEGANISFGARTKWVGRVERELCDPYRARVVALPLNDHELIECVVAIRNCIAHRSQKASDAMNEALLASADTSLRRDARRVTPSGIGAYLFARAGGIRRVETYHLRLSAIAASLRV